MINKIVTVTIYYMHCSIHWVSMDAQMIKGPDNQHPRSPGQCEFVYLMHIPAHGCPWGFLSLVDLLLGRFGNSPRMDKQMNIIRRCKSQVVTFEPGCYLNFCWIKSDTKVQLFTTSQKFNFCWIKSDTLALTSTDDVTPFQYELVSIY